ncbi:Ig-like domain-containing protein [Rhodococcus sp. ACT016]|uniref:Ig-like domain-containing protein n=1 Tax=Rhodococcus sp. ACT016 TaxID=3134808 RepID=UPI003D2BAEEB
MSDKNTRRVLAGLSAFAVAAGFAVTAGVGAASAAPGSLTWDDGNSRFTRTVSNTTPNEGDIVTVSTKFERTGGVVEWLQAVKDLHPTCFTYVSGNTSNPDVKPDYVRVAGNWPVYPNISPKSQTFEFSYRVGADCERGVPLMTTMHYSGSLGDGTYQNKGPTITVSKNTTTTSLAQVAGAQVGQPTTLAATVTGGAQGDTVEFFDGGSKIGAGTLNANGTAIYAWTPGSRGAHELMARFAGTAKANGSESSKQNIEVLSSDIVSTTVIAPVTNAQVGQSTTLKATVSPTAAAGGTVKFKDGGQLLAEVTVNASGEATYAWTPTTDGNHSITADYSGRAGVAASTASATVNVAAKPVQNTDSTTALTVGSAQVSVAQTISAQVTGSAGGTVTFKDGNTVIGTATVDSNGRASISWTPAVQGQRVIRAEYSGSGTVNASADQISVAVAAAPSGGDGDGGDGGTSSAGSLGTMFGSLGG